MTDDVLSAVPSRRGHFLLESGYHTDVWLTLDAVFAVPARIAPLVARLAEKLSAHHVDAVCGPLLGGAFLAQAIATALCVEFSYTELSPAAAGPGLFSARYVLPAGLASRAAGQRIAVVDDVISAGSSVRATIAALTSAGAVPVVVGTLLTLGPQGVAHFESRRFPIETLAQRDFHLWTPDECPLCRAGVALQDPRQVTPQEG